MKRKAQTTSVTDKFNGLFDQVKPGDRIAFIDGPGHTPEHPSYEGIAYGKYFGNYGYYIRVKVTRDNGTVFFETVEGFNSRGMGIGSYYLGRGK